MLDRPATFRGAITEREGRTAGDAVRQQPQANWPGIAQLLVVRLVAFLQVVSIPIGPATATSGEGNRKYFCLIWSSRRFFNSFNFSLAPNLRRAWLRPRPTPRAVRRRSSIALICPSRCRGGGVDHCRRRESMRRTITTSMSARAIRGYSSIPVGFQLPRSSGLPNGTFLREPRSRAGRVFSDGMSNTVIASETIRSTASFNLRERPDAGLPRHRQQQD